MWWLDARLSAAEMDVKIKLLRDLVGTDSPEALEFGEGVFNAPYRLPLIHQVVQAYLAGARSGSKAQKTRAEVRGGGIKPWKQKGTGRARSGTIRSPIWRGGGVTFAAKPRDYSQKVNKKMYRGAMCSILSELVRQDRLLVVENLEATGKTKELALNLKGLGLNQVLIVINELNPNLYLAARNLPWVEVCVADNLDPVSLIKFDKVLFTTAALKTVGEGLS